MPDSAEPRGSRPLFEVLHDFDSDIGVVMLRRRWSPSLERELFEMTVDGMVMMTSGVVSSERELASELLKRLEHSEPNRNGLSVLVGGLGFGFTAMRFLESERVARVTVIERLPEVITWHRDGLLPWSNTFIDDPRIEVRQGDFFGLVAAAPQQRFDAIAIDIDDTPDRCWHRTHSSFYEREHLEALAGHLEPGGALGIWFATDPGERFVAAAAGVFSDCLSRCCEVENPCLRQIDMNHLVLATAR